MSELVSAYPTSAGIYWWASKLGGPRAGFYTGWLNLIGLLGIIASVAYARRVVPQHHASGLFSTATRPASSAATSCASSSSGSSS